METGGGGYKANFETGTLECWEFLVGIQEAGD